MLGDNATVLEGRRTRRRRGAHAFLQAAHTANGGAQDPDLLNEVQGDRKRRNPNPSIDENSTRRKTKISKRRIKDENARVGERLLDQAISLQPRRITVSQPVLRLKGNKLVPYCTAVSRLFDRPLSSSTRPAVVSLQKERPPPPFVAPSTNSMNWHSLATIPAARLNQRRTIVRGVRHARNPHLHLVRLWYPAFSTAPHAGVISHKIHHRSQRIDCKVESWTLRVFPKGLNQHGSLKSTRPTPIVSTSKRPRIRCVQTEKCFWDRLWRDKPCFLPPG